MFNKREKGFTLVELLVVIAIIGLLSTLAVVALGSARAKGRDARRIADVKQYQTALEIFYSDWGYYPEQGQTTPVVLGDDVTCLGADADGVQGFNTTCVEAGGPQYIKSVQAAPTPPSDNTYTYQPNTCAGTAPVKCDTYTITFQLESPTQGLAAGADICATPEGIKDCP